MANNFARREHENNASKKHTGSFLKKKVRKAKPKMKNSSNKNVSNQQVKFKDKISMEILKQPTLIRHMKTKIIIISILVDFILGMLAFTLKGAEYALTSGYTKVAIVLLILYFSQRIIESSFSTYKNLQNDLFSKIYSTKTVEIVMKICTRARNKVFKTADDKVTVMDHAELIQKSKWYIDAAWNFWWSIPTTIAEIITLVIMVTSMIIVELKENDSTQTFIILGLLAICIVIYAILGKKRIKVKKAYRKITKETQATEEVMFTEIKNIDFISQNDFEYHAKRFRTQLLQTREVNKNENLKLNKVFIQRSIIASGFMIIILLIKIFAAQELTMNVILNVVAVSTVYSTILSEIGRIISSCESVLDHVIDINTLYPDFKNIMDVYDEETKKEFMAEDVHSILCGSFFATQDPKKVFMLHNKSPFLLKKGDVVLVEGPTGCGKSTLLLLLTGKLKISNDPIQFSNGTSGYLKSIAYQTDKAMANNYVINEIILSDNIKTLEKSKLLEILVGLRLYDEILKMAKMNAKINLMNITDEDMVIKFLCDRKVSQFSSGQQQRLALAKLLYTMTSEHQVISLDEAFNRLDDETASACIRFVNEYTQKDVRRIVFMATHQVNLVQPVCNKHISFESNMNVSEMKITDLRYRQA